MKDKDDNSLDQLDAEEEALRNEAMEVSPPRPEDATLTDDVNTDKQAAGAAEKPAKKTDKPAADKPAGEPEKAKQSEGAKPKDQKSEAKSDAEKPKGDEEDANLSPYQKERARLDRTWKQVNTEKESLRKDRETFDAERKKWEAERAQPAEQKPKGKPRHNGFTAEEYEAVAADWKAEGKIEDAEKALEIARKLREQEKQDGTPAAGDFVTLTTGGRVTKEEHKQMTDRWQAHLQRLGKELPDLGEEGKPLRTEVTRLLKEFPLLHASGDGIQYAVQIAQLQLKANRSEELEQRVAELEKQNAELTALTSLPPSGGGGAKPHQRKIEDMPIEEAEKELERQAMESDARGGGG